MGLYLPFDSGLMGPMVSLLMVWPNDTSLWEVRERSAVVCEAFGHAEYVNGGIPCRLAKVRLGIMRFFAMYLRRWGGAWINVM